MGLLDGITTNPSILSKEEKCDFKEHVQKIISLLDRYEYLILEEDKDIKFQEIIERNDFTKIDQQSKNFGINNDVVWLKYVVENNSENWNASIGQNLPITKILKLIQFKKLEIIPTV